MRLIRLARVALVYLVIAVAVLLFLHNAVGCEDSSSSTRRSGGNSPQHSTNRPSSGGQTQRPQSDGQSGAPKIDPKVLAQAEREVKDEAADLGQVRKELGELVERAVKTQRALLEAKSKLPAPQSDNKESEVYYGNQ